MSESLASIGLTEAARSTQVFSRYENSVMNTFGTPQRVLVRGEGCYVWDADGKRYLDLLAGIAVNALGHAHPTLVAAVSAQLGTLGHVSNFFATIPQVRLAEGLLELCEAPTGSRVFFANSGAEANEAAFKMARRTGRSRILALGGAFHGRTMGALALTAKAAYRDPFAPLPAGVEHVPFGDVDALDRAMDDDVAAIFIEPVQGEAGVRPLRPEYLRAARDLATRYGALLVLDEVQSGVGRSGRFLSYQREDVGGGIVPDVVTLAKGLGGGVPIGAVVAYGERAATLLGPGQHGTTFGGNPIAAAAALATLHVIDRDRLLENVAARSEQLRSGILELGRPEIVEVRGVGLLLGIELVPGEAEPSASDVALAALAAGFIVNAVGPSTVRLAPPLILGRAEAQTFVAALPAILDAARRVEPPAASEHEIPTEPSGSEGAHIPTTEGRNA